MTTDPIFLVNRERRAQVMAELDAGGTVRPVEHPAPRTPGTPLAALPDGPFVAVNRLAQEHGWLVVPVGACGRTLGTLREVNSISLRMSRWPAPPALGHATERAVAVWWNDGSGWKATGGWWWLAGSGVPVNIGVTALAYRLRGQEPPPPPPPATKRVCVRCGREVAPKADGTLRMHGPRADRCPGK